MDNGSQPEVIFYGPPGTGKTYVAQRLAQAIAGDPSRQVIVQFHPSSSYEDFFEGYRPDKTAGEADTVDTVRAIHGIKE